MSGFKMLRPIALGLLLYGCSMFGGLSSNAVPPVLIQKTPFPPLPPALAARSFDLKTDLIVSRTGSVIRAALMNSSGDPEWDSLAIRNILNWKYSPATLSGKPIQMRISQVAHVIYTPPLTMILSQVVCTTKEEADSIYSSLQGGKSFDSVLDEIKPTGSVISSGYLGEVDIRQYPEDIQTELQRLEANSYSLPLHLGIYYAIFLRHSQQKVQSLPR